MRPTPIGKIAALIVVVGLAYGGYRWYSGRTPSAGADSGTPQFGSTKVEGDLGLNGKLGRPLHVALNQWPGWLGGIFANNGLKPNKACIFWSKYNLLVEFQVMDDPVAMTNEFAAGRVDLAWSTMDTAATQLGGLKKGGTPSKVLFQVDYSQGGDAIVARQGINEFEDLKGKTVALIPLSPSETLLRYGVLNSSLTESQKKAILNGKITQDLPNAVVSTFTAGKADAIVTWEPNISAALKEVKGSHVIFSSETAATLIGDCFLAQTSFISEHGNLIKAFIQGWFDGAFEAQNNPRKAVQTMMESFPDFQSLGEQGSMDTFNKVKLTGLADNARTFGLGGASPQFDVIFNQANSFYVDAVQDQVTAKDAKDDRFVRQIFAAQEPARQKPTPMETMKPTSTQKDKATTADPVFTKPLTIRFGSGSSELSAFARQMIEAKVVPLLRTSPNAFFRIEGNTDSVGNHDSNVALSLRRANAVVNYLANKGFNADRLIPVGNGPDKPVADNSSAAGKQANRRTDVKLVANQ
jgi:NitT/TauT family transport system substrate-binding protein